MVKSDTTCLTIQQVKWQDLKDLFKSCGTVVRADVMEEPGGRSKGIDVLYLSKFWIAFLLFYLNHYKFFSLSTIIFVFSVITCLCLFSFYFWFLFYHLLSFNVEWIGCGIVEFSTPQEAQQAMADLNDTEFIGRQVFIREDREEGVLGGGGVGGMGTRWDF